MHFYQRGPLELIKTMLKSDHVLLRFISSMDELPNSPGGDFCTGLSFGPGAAYLPEKV